MSDSDSDNNTEPTQFNVFLLHHNKGRSHEELSDTLQKLVAAVVDTGKKGTLTYTVTVNPAENYLVVSDEIKVRLPEHNRPASVFFATDQHQLVRNDPNQMSLLDLAKENSQ